MSDLRDKIAAVIRRVDGSHSMGAGALAEAIASSPECAQVKAEAQVEALREVAQAWQTGGWAQGMPPRDSQRPQLIVGMAQRATDFIRDRANRIAREAGIETGEEADSD